jgi:hypothetical protein
MKMILKLKMYNFLILNCKKLPKSIQPGSLLSKFTVEASLLNDGEDIERMWKRFVAIVTSSFIHLLS